jgi:23S rRNA pseudouridine955/2504/2580 synthase
MAKRAAMAPADSRTFTVADDDDGIRLDRWFKRHLADVSFNQVSRWARTGQLRVDGKRAAPGDRLEAGQVLRLPPPEIASVASQAPRKRELVVLTDDEREFVEGMIIDKGRDYFLLNKPPGLATQGGTKTKNHLDRLLHGLADDEGNRPKLVHRLDKDTSGALLVARTARAAGHYAKAFAGRTAKKIYWAIITGVPSIDDGLVDLPLAKQPGTGGEKMHVDEKDGQAAKTRYRVIDRAGNRAAWVELQPLTGRTHQLRAHMAAIGHPIVGDAKYGGADAFLTGGISRKMHLHARRLRIDGLDRREIDGRADLPAHFAETLASLGFEEIVGDQMPMDAPQAPTKEVKAKRAAAHAKAYRKARKGERRARGSTPAPRGKAPSRGGKTPPPRGGKAPTRSGKPGTRKP